MPFCRLFYHLVWATKNREPLLTPQVEPVIHGLLRSKAVRLRVQVFALNGIEDHVHLIASIPPSLAVATLVGQVKAASSTLFNKAHSGNPPFFWQQEYGAFTFDSKRLPYHVEYVLHQKEHHGRGTAIQSLEPHSAPGIETQEEAESTESRTTLADRRKVKPR
jgi:putative transposase